MRFREVAGVILLSIVISAMISCGAALCRGVEAPPARPNDLGVVLAPPDPNDVLVGSLIGGQEIQDGDGRIGIAIRVHPVATYALYDEGLFFCGNVIDQMVVAGTLQLRPGNLVFIYRRSASRLINGVPCHALRAVLEVK